MGWALLELPTIDPPPAPEGPSAAALASLAASASPEGAPTSPSQAAAEAQEELDRAAAFDPLDGRAGFSTWEQKHRPGLKTYLRVPCYVSHTHRALARLPANDAASLAREHQHAPGGGGASGTHGSGGGTSDEAAGNRFLQAMAAAALNKAAGGQADGEEAPGTGGGAGAAPGGAAKVGFLGRFLKPMQDVRVAQLQVQPTRPLPLPPVRKI